MTKGLIYFAFFDLSRRYDKREPLIKDKIRLNTRLVQTIKDYKNPSTFQRRKHWRFKPVATLMVSVY